MLRRRNLRSDERAQLGKMLAELAEDVTEACDGQWTMNRRDIALRLYALAGTYGRTEG